MMPRLPHESHKSRHGRAVSIKLPFFSPSVPLTGQWPRAATLSFDNFWPILEPKVTQVILIQHQFSSSIYNNIFCRENE